MKAEIIKIINSRMKKSIDDVKSTAKEMMKNESK